MIVCELDRHAHLCGAIDARRTVPFDLRLLHSAKVLSVCVVLARRAICGLSRDYRTQCKDCSLCGPAAGFVNVVQLCVSVVSYTSFTSTQSQLHIVHDRGSKVTKSAIHQQQLRVYNYTDSRNRTDTIEEILLQCQQISHYVLISPAE